MRKLFLLLVLVGLTASAQSRPVGFKLLRDAGIAVNIGYVPAVAGALTLSRPDLLFARQFSPVGDAYQETSPSMLPPTLRGAAIDSFNPGGATNMPTALGMGVIRSLWRF